MKEEDLRKHLDNILIDGLLKEADQENAEFEAAMRKLSNSEFNDIISENPPKPKEKEMMIIPEIRACRMLEELPDRTFSVSAPEDSMSEFDDEIEFSNTEGDFESSAPKPMPKPSRWKALRPWIVSVAAAAAVILAVLIPSINFMNGRLCDSALYMSQEYITASKGGLDLSTATNEQIKGELPALQSRYEELIKRGAYEEPGFEETAWDLATAYLKLHKKSDAVKVLKTLESHRRGTPMGDHCQKLLEQLD